jgi:uncharacterized damage-inducible protein DinB
MMQSPLDESLLRATLDGWWRSNRALSNLLQALPPHAVHARALPSSPTIGQICSHIHHERLVSVLENVPEAARAVPAVEWADADDLGAIVMQLADSAACVAEAVERRSRAARGLDKDFSAPVQLLLFLIFHDGYHHGQIKLALKAAGLSLPEDVVGREVWDVWRRAIDAP